MKATVSGVLEDLKFKNSEGSDKTETATWAVSGKHQFWLQLSDTLNLRSSNTQETVDFTPS